LGQQSRNRSIQVGLDSFAVGVPILRHGENSRRRIVKIAVQLEKKTFALLQSPRSLFDLETGKGFDVMRKGGLDGAIEIGCDDGAPYDSRDQPDRATSERLLKTGFRKGLANGVIESIRSRA
jgi:hypothetical protein